MDHSISLSGPTWQVLQEAANTTGFTPAKIVEDLVREHVAPLREQSVTKPTYTEQEMIEADERLFRCFGSIHSGLGADNESIDAD